MKLRALLLLLVLPVSLARGGEIFRAEPGTAPAHSRLFTVTPGQIRSGTVTELVIRGENLSPRNQWSSPGIRILKEQFVDPTLTLLTVVASGSPGLTTLAANDSAPLSIELLPSGDIFHDDFNDGELSGWNAASGTWIVDQNQASVSGSGRLLAQIEDTDNVKIDFDITLNSGIRAGLYFQYRDSDNYRQLYFDGRKGKATLIDRFEGSNETKASVAFTNTSAPHHVTLVVTNNIVDISLDSAPLLNRDLHAVYGGAVGFYSKKATVHFDNINIYRDPAANMIPLAEFNWSATALDASFNAAGSQDPDGSLVSYAWQFGDGATGSGQQAAHTYSSGGTKDVTLILTDNSGAATKIRKSITLTAPTSDKQMIEQTVLHFFQLFDDVEHLTGTQICVDFSHDPSCPARQKQIADIDKGKLTVIYNEVFYLSNVLITFESSTKAYPVKIHNLFKYQVKGDPVIHTTDGWHIYHMQKESDGKWHQCSYTFQLVSQS